MKKVSLGLCCSVALLACLFAFQNCGGKFASQESSSNSLQGSSSPSSTVTVTPGGGGTAVSGQAQNIQVNPGDPVDLALTLSSAATQDLNFTYQTADDTALSGQHYVATSGSGVIAAGQTIGHIALTTTNNPGLVYLGRDFKVTILIPTISVNQTVNVTFKSGLADVVLKNTWSAISAVGAPSARTDAASVWTGSKILVFGGIHNISLGDGYSYDPVLDKWAPISSVGAPSARTFMAYAWTGSKMIVWGGQLQPGVPLVLTNTGAMYDPATDTWKAMSSVGAPSARQYPYYAWTGSKFIVWGGMTGSPSLGGSVFNNGAMYDPQTDTWSPMTTVGAPAARYQVSCKTVWTGTKFVVWGGGNTGFVPGGALYDPVTNTWETINATGAPAVRTSEAMVWTGTKILVWGGSGSDAGGNTVALANGAAYDPVTKTWSTISPTGAPAARYYPATAWTGSQMIIWGGSSTTTTFNNGGIYDLATDTWKPMTATTLAARFLPSFLWTGTQMFIFGGSASADGGVFQ